MLMSHANRNRPSWSSLSCRLVGSRLADSMISYAHVPMLDYLFLFFALHIWSATCDLEIMTVEATTIWYLNNWTLWHAYMYPTCLLSAAHELKLQHHYIHGFAQLMPHMEGMKADCSEWHKASGKSHKSWCTYETWWGQYFSSLTIAALSNDKQASQLTTRTYCFQIDPGRWSSLPGERCRSWRQKKCLFKQEIKET